VVQIHEVVQDSRTFLEGPYRNQEEKMDEEDIDEDEKDIQVVQGVRVDDASSAYLVDKKVEGLLDLRKLWRW